MSEVEILYKALEFTFSMIYKILLNIKQQFFSEIIYIISEISQS